MAAQVKLGGSLPGDDRNGLGAHYRDMVEHPGKRRILIAIVDVGKVVTEYSDDEASESPVLRMRRVEIITDGDMPSAHRILQRAWEDRSGTPVLPIELEDDLKNVFAGIDLDALEAQVTIDGVDQGPGTPGTRPDDPEPGEQLPDEGDPFADPFGD